MSASTNTSMDFYFGSVFLTSLGAVMWDKCANFLIVWPNFGSVSVDFFLCSLNWTLYNSVWLAGPKPLRVHCSLYLIRQQNCLTFPVRFPSKRLQSRDPFPSPSKHLRLCMPQSVICLIEPQSAAVRCRWLDSVGWLLMRSIGIFMSSYILFFGC